MKNFEFEDQEKFEDFEKIHIEEKSKRASRRHHLKRMKSKAKKKYKYWNSINNEEIAEEFAVKNANHLANCSCHACGNPRHHFKGKDKLTKQEILSKEAMKEQLDEI